MLAEDSQPRETKQGALFKPVKPLEKHVKLSDILPYRSDDEVNPKTNLAKSIAAWGADHSSVTLLQTPKGYEVWNGRRRLDAYVTAGLTHIRAKVYPEGTSRTYLAGVALASHLSRKSNPLDEARQIALLSEEGLTLEQIAEKLGVPVHTIKRLNAINSFPDHIVAAIRSSKMTLEGGFTYTKLDKRAKKDVDRQLQLGEKIHAKDLKERRKAQHSQAFADALFDISQYEPPTPSQLFRNAISQALNNGLTKAQIQQTLEEVFDDA